MRRTGLRTGFALAVLALAELCSPVQAADGYWTADANGYWTNAVNWAGGTIANGAGSTAYFTNDITATRVITLTSTGPVTNGAIVIGDINGSSSFSILGASAANSGLLVFYNGADGATLTQLSAGFSNTVGVASGTPTLNIRLDSDLSVTNLSTNTLYIGGVIAGAKAVSVAGGTGGVMLLGNNTFSGGLTLKSGLLKTGTGTSSFGTGLLTLGGTGELQILNSADRVMLNSGTALNGDATITSGRNAPGGLGAGWNYTLNALTMGAQTLTVQAGSTVTSGVAAVTFGATTINGASVFNVTNNMAGVTSALTLGALNGTGGSLTKNGDGSVHH